MNRYSPHYDPDEGRVAMGLDAEGSWVHIKTAESLCAQRDHFKEQLRERAEALLDARAQIERFRNAVREKERLELAAVQELDEARAEVKRLAKALDVCSSVHVHNVKLHKERERLRDVAERQREACASMVEDADDGVPLQCLADAIRATPLVTDGEEEE